MTRDVHVYVADILESICKIQQYTKEVSRDDFMENTQIQDAVVRRLEIIGEAVKKESASPRVAMDKIRLTSRVAVLATVLAV